MKTTLLPKSLLWVIQTPSDVNGVESENIGVAFCRASLLGAETNWKQNLL